jgi:hypothetical protein
VHLRAGDAPNRFPVTMLPAIFCLRLAIAEPQSLERQGPKLASDMQRERAPPQCQAYTRQGLQRRKKCSRIGAFIVAAFLGVLMAVMPALLLHGETLNRSEGTTRQKGVQYGIVPRLAGGMKFCHRQVQKLNYQFKRRQ